MSPEDSGSGVKLKEEKENEQMVSINSNGTTSSTDKIKQLSIWNYITSDNTLENEVKSIHFK